MDPDIIYNIGLYLDIDHIVNYCLAAKKHRDVICDGPFYWLARLKSEYGVTNDYIPSNNTPKEYYKLIYTNLRDRNDRAALNNILMDAVTCPGRRRARMTSESVTCGNIRLVELVLDAGADIDHLRGYAIKQATMNKNMELILYLMNRGANYEIDNGIILAIAARTGDVELYEFFRDWGVDPDQDMLIRSLYSASVHGRLDMVRHLVEKERVDVKGKDNQAVKAASKKGHQDIVEYLLSQGASLD